MHPQEDPKVLSGRIYNIEHFWGSDEYTKTTKVMAEHNTSVAEYREKSKGVTLIHLMNLWLIGVKNDNVPPFGVVDTNQSNTLIIMHANIQHSSRRWLSWSDSEEREECG